MRVLVCGGRDFYNWRLLEDTLYEIQKEYNINCIIQGGASGADALAKQWAKYYFTTIEEYPADWNMYGKKAGYTRNRQMLEDGRPDLIIAFPGGKGTANMVKLGQDAGIEVRIIK